MMNLNLKSILRIFVRENLIDYMPKASILANAFMDSEFNYTPFDVDVCWENINKTCKIDHRTIRWFTMNIYKSYDELPKLNNNVSIHQKHL